MQPMADLRSRLQKDYQGQPIAIKVHLTTPAEMKVKYSLEGLAPT